MREHGDRRESGHGIHFVDDDGSGFFIVEEVDACQTFAFQSVERAGSRVADLLFEFGRHVCRADQADGFGVDVFEFVVVELAFGNLDFAEGRGARVSRGGSEDAAFDFASNDSGFDDDARVSVLRFLHGDCKLARGIDFGDTDGGACATGLHEHGVSECAHAVGACLGVFCPLKSGDEFPLPHVDSGCGKHGLRQVLVHRDCAGGDATSDVADVRHLEEALDGAVFAVGSVQ